MLMIRGIGGKRFLIRSAGVLLGVLLSAGCLFAQEISVTSVSIDNSHAHIIINEVIQINEILIKEDELEFPVFVSRSGQVFPQVSFRTSQARDTVFEAVKTGRPSEERIRRITYKITDLSTYRQEGSSLRGFATVTFNGVLDIECRIMQSRHDGSYWVSWPARPPDEDRDEDSWVDQVSIINRRVRDIVEQDIIEQYREKTVDEEAEIPDRDVSVRVVEGPVDTPVTVTDVKVEPVTGEGSRVASAEVELNYSIRIMDIKVHSRRGEIFLEYPVSVAASGREFDQMRVLSRELGREIRRAVETGEPSEEKYAEVGFEITKFERFDSDSALKYFCGVTINQVIEIECAIIDGPGYDAFVSWPSRRENGDYVDQIIPVNSDFRDAVERALLSKYQRELRSR